MGLCVCVSVCECVAVCRCHGAAFHGVFIPAGFRVPASCPLIGRTGVSGACFKPRPFMQISRKQKRSNWRRSHDPPHWLFMTSLMMMTSAASITDLHGKFFPPFSD